MNETKRFVDQFRTEISNPRKTLLLKAEDLFSDPKKPKRFEPPVYQQEVRNLIERLNLCNNVDILGLIPHAGVIRYLAIAHIGIFFLQLVSERYNWGESIKYFEYSAAGFPTIISDLPPKRRLVEKNQNGILINPLDEESIAKAIASLLNDPHRMEEMWKGDARAFSGSRIASP